MVHFIWNYESVFNKPIYSAFNILPFPSGGLSTRQWLSPSVCIFSLHAFFRRVSEDLLLFKVQTVSMIVTQRFCLDFQLLYIAHNSAITKCWSEPSFSQWLHERAFEAIQLSYFSKSGISFKVIFTAGKKDIANETRDRPKRVQLKKIHEQICSTGFFPKGTKSPAKAPWLVELSR